MDTLNIYDFVFVKPPALQRYYPLKLDQFIIFTSLQYKIIQIEYKNPYYVSHKHNILNYSMYVQIVNSFYTVKVLSISLPKNFPLLILYYLSAEN